VLNSYKAFFMTPASQKGAIADFSKDSLAISGRMESFGGGEANVAAG
jgi:hypothetical protein